VRFRQISPSRVLRLTTCWEPLDFDRWRNIAGQEPVNAVYDHLFFGQNIQLIPELAELVERGDTRVLRLDSPARGSVLTELEYLAYDPARPTFIIHHGELPRVYCLISEAVKTDTVWVWRGPGGGYHAEWYPYRDRHFPFCSRLDTPKRRSCASINELDGQVTSRNFSRDRPPRFRQHPIRQSSSPSRLSSTWNRGSPRSVS
jgi:hypothetical protein